MTNLNEILIKAEGKQEIEVLIAVLNLGICTALENNLMTLEQVESYLYSPYTIEHLRRLEVNQDLIGLIHLGTELENVKSLIPEKYQESISEIKLGTHEFIKTLADSSAKNVSRKKWIRTKS